ncbi:hypothetical protein BH23ACT3_BH23ACT3_19530 [soil metagenome]
MWVAWMIVGIVAVLVIVAVRAALVGTRVGRPRTDDQSEVTDPHETEFPSVGEPSPHRPDGRPIPGSRDDRREKRSSGDHYHDHGDGHHDHGDGERT